jgi:hypothetical protein
MKKSFLLIPTLTFIFYCLNGQDVIIQNNGTRTDCKILKTDSVNVYFAIKQKGKIIDTFLPKSRIEEITYVSILPYTCVSDSIVVWRGRTYYHSDLITTKRAIDILKSNDAANGMYKRSIAPAGIAYVFSYMGGFLIAYPIGTFFAGSKTHWTGVYIGAGLIALAIPFDISSHRIIRKSIDTYNRNAPRFSSIHKTKTIGITKYGLTFCLNF